MVYDQEESTDTLPVPHNVERIWPYDWRWPGEGTWLDQDLEWMPADKRVVRLEDMTLDHQAHLWFFLHRNALVCRQWHVELCRRHGVEPPWITFEGLDSWLLETVFMRRLTALVVERIPASKE